MNRKIVFRIATVPKAQSSKRHLSGFKLSYTVQKHAILAYVHKIVVYTAIQKLYMFTTVKAI